MNKKIKNILLFTATSIAALHACNRFLSEKAISKKKLTCANGSFYNWKLGKIFYQKSGFGKPVLLVHDLTPSASSYEFSNIVEQLAKEHTVYTIDLLGCGLSDKPPIIYTNYLYVQLITSFIQNVIKEKPYVMASGYSSSFVIMSTLEHPDLYSDITLINPMSFDAFYMEPTRKDLLVKNTLQTPLIGTFLYHILYRKGRISKLFDKHYYCFSDKITQNLKDIYYESAHLGEENGRYLLASRVGRYFNADVKKAYTKLKTPHHIIWSQNLISEDFSPNEYKKLNYDTDHCRIDTCRMYPHLEKPDKVLHLFHSFHCS